MSSTTTKPSLPENYVVPTVWELPTSASGSFAGINRPTAGAQKELPLKRGTHPIQLYSLGTPNGQKVTILLEELGIEYDAWRVDIMSGDQFGSGFVEINPNSKIPALVDHSNPDHPQRVFESGSILIYLAEKYGKFLPTDFSKKTEVLNWLFWQMGTAPFIGGGFGHFYKYAPINVEYAINRYSMETKRILDVLDKHLANNTFILDDEYTIADIAIYPWIRCIDVSLNATEFLQTKSYVNVRRWLEIIEARPAVKRGLRVNGFGSDAVVERHSADDFK